jgi:hypothetical protein
VDTSSKTCCFLNMRHKHRLWPIWVEYSQVFKWKWFAQFIHLRVVFVNFWSLDSCMSCFHVYMISCLHECSCLGY